MLRASARLQASFAAYVGGRAESKRGMAAAGAKGAEIVLSLGAELGDGGGMTTERSANVLVARR